MKQKGMMRILAMAAAFVIAVTSVPTTAFTASAAEEDPAAAEWSVEDPEDGPEEGLTAGAEGEGDGAPADDGADAASEDGSGDDGSRASRSARTMRRTRTANR
ncbi:MAG: hypothetical protein J6I56_07585 [Lachnospiraceae bacterium]|nr:hypothetical protein [Lachnospiraceae bacterium]